MGQAIPEEAMRPYSARRFWWMMGNATRLKCPTCGEKPMFVPWSKVRSWRDWLMPLDGCTNCGYAYEREPGYYLLSIWGVNYGVGAMVGLGLYFIFDFWLHLPIWWTITLVVLLVPFFNLWFARHSKAYFLAFDLFFDPHRRDGGDGDQPIPSPGPTPHSPEPVVRSR